MGHQKLVRTGKKVLGINILKPAGKPGSQSAVAAHIVSQRNQLTDLQKVVERQERAKLVKRSEDIGRRMRSTTRRARGK